MEIQKLINCIVIFNSAILIYLVFQEITLYGLKKRVKLLEELANGKEEIHKTDELNNIQKLNNQNFENLV